MEGAPMRYDVAIIGTGPAGLFAAYELRETGLKVILIDRGEEPMQRKHISFGVGGAGAFSDGKLNLTSKIGGDPASLNRDATAIQLYIDKIDAVFTQFGAPERYSGEDPASLFELKKEASRYGIEFISGRQRHMGTSKVRVIIDRFYHYLRDGGIAFSLVNPIEKIEKRGDLFVLSGSTTIEAKYLLAAPGRASAYWLREEARRMNIRTEYGPIDVGIRVEFPAEIYAPIEKIMYDAKLRVRTETYDDMVRSFCTNPRGFVVQESYSDYVLVNGHAENDEKTDNTNFALLSHIELTDPVEDTTEYGRAIAQLATTIGGGKPILQRLKDLKDGRRSTEERIRRAAITPTLKDVTPGDISMALPSRVVVNLSEGLDKLNYIIPGLNADNTLLYAPEIKFYDTRYPLSATMETECSRFYIAGDASGYSRGIVYAAVTGLIAAEGIRAETAA